MVQLPHIKRENDMKTHAMKDGTVYYTDPVGRITLESELWNWKLTVGLVGYLVFMCTIGFIL